MTVGLGLSLIGVLAAFFWFGLLFVICSFVLWGSGGPESRSAAIRAGAVFMIGTVWILWGAGPGKWIAQSNCTNRIEVAPGVSLPLRIQGVLLPQRLDYRTHSDVLSADRSTVYRLLRDRNIGFVETPRGVFSELDGAFGVTENQPARYTLADLTDARCSALARKVTASLARGLVSSGGTFAEPVHCLVAEPLTDKHNRVALEISARYDERGNRFGLGHYAYIRYELVERKAGKVVASTHDFVYSKFGVGDAFYCANTDSFRKLSSPSAFGGL